MILQASLGNIAPSLSHRCRWLCYTVLLWPWGSWSFQYVVNRCFLLLFFKLFWTYKFVTHHFLDVVSCRLSSQQTPSCDSLPASLSAFEGLNTSTALSYTINIWHPLSARGCDAVVLTTFLMNNLKNFRGTDIWRISALECVKMLWWITCKRWFLKPVNIIAHNSWW